jgi:hypothetical protein
MYLVSWLTAEGWKHYVRTFWPSAQVASELLLRKVADECWLCGFVFGFWLIGWLTEGELQMSHRLALSVLGLPL